LVQQQQNPANQVARHALQVCAREHEPGYKGGVQQKAAYNSNSWSWNLPATLLGEQHVADEVEPVTDTWYKTATWLPLCNTPCLRYCSRHEQIPLQRNILATRLLEWFAAGSRGLVQVLCGWCHHSKQGHQQTLPDLPKAAPSLPNNNSS
jgi:hypothetical protein